MKTVALFTLCIAGLFIMFTFAQYADADNYLEPEKSIQISNKTGNSTSHSNSNSKSTSNSKSNSSASIGDIKSNTTNNITLSSPPQEILNHYESQDRIDVDGDTHVNFTLPNTAVDSYGDGVSCSKSTVGGGVYGDSDKDYGGFVGITIPLGGTRCDRVAAVQEEIKRTELLTNKATLANMCLDIHHKATVRPNAEEYLLMWNQFCTGLKPNHGGARGIATEPHSTRMAPHKH